MVIGRKVAKALRGNQEPFLRGEFSSSFKFKMLAFVRTLDVVLLFRTGGPSVIETG